MAARPFLELTKLQNRILFEYVRKQGFAEGVQKLYQRLRRDIGDMAPCDKRYFENQKKDQFGQLRKKDLFVESTISSSKEHAI